MNHSKKLLGGLAALASAGLIAGAVAPAHADPVRPYASVGSDTIQDVWNALTNDATAVAPTIASFNAFDNNGDAYQIKTKTAGTWFVRPSGSGEGVKALSATWNPDAVKNHNWLKAPSVPLGAVGPTTAVSSTLNHEDVDLARSSSAGSNSGNADLTYIPFARDAVSIAYKSASLTGLNFTTAQLTELYKGVDDPTDDTASMTVTITGSGPTINTGAGAVAVHPQIPQNGSGTRKFFLGAIGVTTAQLASYIPNPNVSTAAGGLPENDGSALVNDGDLIPFSAAQWAAQANLAPGVTDTRAADQIANINGQAPFGTGTPLVPGPLYGTGSFGNFTTQPSTTVLGTFNRDTFDVIPATFRGTGATGKQSNLVNILTAAGGLGSNNAKAIIKQYGFGTLGYISNASTYGSNPFTN